MALMYEEGAEREQAGSAKRRTLLRARAYAVAALRDFQHYEGRASEPEADAQRLLDIINGRLAELPE